MSRGELVISRSANVETFSVYIFGGAFEKLLGDIKAGHEPAVA